MKEIMLTLLLCLLLSSQTYANSLDGNDNITIWNKENPVEIREITSDENDDGKTDYVMYYTKAGQKIAEKMDFNKDGIMDDFYFYNNGVLKFRQIDSNFDNKIDIWVYISKGVYIEKYEKDTDFDGTVDYTRDYNEAE